MLSLILLTITVLLGTGCQTNHAVHRQFSKRVRELHTVAILPIKATAIKMGMAGPEPDQFPQVEEFQRQLIAQLTPQMESRGFKVIQSKLPAGHWGAITNGFEKREIWLQCQLHRAYEKWVDDWLPGYPSRQLMRPEAELLAEYEGADALLFIRAEVITETPLSAGKTAALVAAQIGMVALMVPVAVLSGGSSGLGTMGSEPKAGCRLKVVLVDGRSGDILWRSFVEPKSLESASLEQTVKRVFSSYPKQ